MRRILLSTLAAMALLAPVAAQAQTKTAPPAAPAPAAPAPQLAEETLFKIKDSGRILVGYRAESPPFSVKGADGNPEGYTIDICLRIVEAVRQVLQAPDLKVEYVQVTGEDRVQAVVEGKIDLECGSTTQTLLRRTQVDFSLPVFVDGAGLLTKSGQGIDTAQQMKGKKIAVMTGSTTEVGMKGLIAANKLDTKLFPVKDHQEGMADLIAGKVDAYVTDRTMLETLRRQQPNPDKLVLGKATLSYEPYGIMLRRGDPDFRLLVDAVIAKTYRGGAIDGIFKKWFDPLGAEPSSLLQAMFILNAIPE